MNTNEHELDSSEGANQVMAEKAKTSGVAIAALVLGILGFFTFMLTALPAVICGVIAHVKIGKSGGGLKGKGLAISGIFISVVVLPMFMAILTPALDGIVKNIATSVVCPINMKGLWTPMVIYAADHDDMFPPADKWCDVLIAETDADPKQLKCPKAPEGRCNYAMNENIAKFGSKAPANMVLLFESRPGWNLSGGSEMLTGDNHFGEGANVLFADGHVEFVKSKNFRSLNWRGGGVVCSFWFLVNS